LERANIIPTSDHKFSALKIEVTKPSVKNEVTFNQVEYIPEEKKENSFNDKDIYNDDYEDKEIKDDNVFGNVQISINADKDSVLGKVLNVAESITYGENNFDAPSIVSHISNLAKGWQSVSEKFNSVKKKIDSQRLKDVQGFENPKNDQIAKEKQPKDNEFPVGPEVRQGDQYEKQMQEGSQKPSLFNSIVQNVGPAVLAGLDKSNNQEGGSFIDNFMSNIGPKIISEQMGSGSVMGVLGGLAPLLNSPSDGKTRSVSDTLTVLKPVLNAMAPSIMEKILYSKQTKRKYIDEDPMAGGEPTPMKKDKTIVDQMLHGMDEKTVGQVSELTLC